jgi:hypothetical protein
LLEPRPRLHAPPKTGEAPLHWPVVIVEPAMLKKHEVSQGREPVLFKDRDLGRGCVDLAEFALPVCLPVRRAVPGQPREFGHGLNAARFRELPPR